MADFMRREVRKVKEGMVVCIVGGRGWLFVCVRFGKSEDKKVGKS